MLAFVVAASLNGLIKNGSVLDGLLIPVPQSMSRDSSLVAIAAVRKHT